MSANVQSPTSIKRPTNAERPFPSRCRHCGKNEVYPGTIDYNAEVRHDGRLHRFVVARLDLPLCRACGEKVFTEAADRQINVSLRSHLKLLTPEQIRGAIARLGYSQKDVAQRLGIAEATLSRWLNETQIQSRALDNLLRLFFAYPQVQEALAGELPDPAVPAPTSG